VAEAASTVAASLAASCKLSETAAAGEAEQVAVSKLGQVLQGIVSCLQQSCLHAAVIFLPDPAGEDAGALVGGNTGIVVRTSCDMWLQDAGGVPVC